MSSDYTFVGGKTFYKGVEQTQDLSVLPNVMHVHKDDYPWWMESSTATAVVLRDLAIIQIVRKDTVSTACQEEAMKLISELGYEVEPNWKNCHTYREGLQIYRGGAKVGHKKDTVGIDWPAKYTEGAEFIYGLAAPKLPESYSSFQEQVNAIWAKLEAAWLDMPDRAGFETLYPLFNHYAEKYESLFDELDALQQEIYFYGHD